MKKLIFVFLISITVYAQNTFKVTITDEHSGDPLPGVNILVLNTLLGASTNEEGYAEIKNIPDGLQQLKFSYIGYKEQIIQLNFPLQPDDIFEIELEEEAEELEEIAVSSTRSSRLISDEPARVEVITGEEIEEKINMDPSSISMVLNESTGIQVQQTSAASVNSTFRIQGLEGRYTQLLRDGLPLYSGYSGSLSINQIPPLDLKQVEIIKGSSSTLYGGGAIAGLINLISKEPEEKREISFLLNGTTATGLDLSGYYSEKFEHVGVTVFASHNTQQTYDNNDDRFTDLPETDRYSVNPKVYFYFNDDNTLQVGGNITYEERTGGYIPAIEKTDAAGYTEINKSNRYSTQLKFDSRISEGRTLGFKNSFGYFNRNIILPSYSFKGSQLSGFSELTYTVDEEEMQWIFGLNMITTSFNDESGNPQDHSFANNTFGAFMQNTIDVSDNIALESGFRTDYNNKYGWFALPRLSLLVEWNDELTSRIGGGLGYKLPEIFTEDAEELFFRNINPLPQGELEAEKSYGLNFDINYRTIIADKITLSVNNLFFYTRITDPVILVYNEQNNLHSFESFDGHYDTEGIETNIKITYGNFKLFTGYTFTDVRRHSGNDERVFPLTPKNKLGMILFYEKHGDIRIGLEGYYTGKQRLSNNNTTPDYWVTGLMIEKKFANVSIFLNFENFTDTKQGDYGPVYTGSISNPEFVEIFAPTDGRIINGGVKIRL